MPGLRILSVGRDGVRVSVAASGGALAELHLRQNEVEVFETATPRWSNAPNRHIELLGDRLVREIVVAHQQAQEALTTG